ncbi:hypothetical protein [Intestinirhabdus alba]|jgi:hypothetical protein|uniref:Uncharacterized protein n=1 Tax=Intestinirhabdus alba TaxID=2899544 RepID=A0A6L6IUR4_9ENTR|nr:hypothetical protein [Intestinirhabdus alba]MTH48750.1 hypothetical protein [Intestinirhabdus alba]
MTDFSLQSDSPEARSGPGMGCIRGIKAPLRLPTFRTVNDSSNDKKPTFFFNYTLNNSSCMKAASERQIRQERICPTTGRLR